MEPTTKDLVDHKAELIALSKIKEDTGFPETADALRQCATRLEELERDRVRLDWLDSQGMGQNPRVWSVYQFSENVRQAIDTAMEDKR